MTGILCTQPQSVCFDQYYDSGNQHMSRSRNVRSAFGSAAPAQTRETSSRSQWGLVL